MRCGCFCCAAGHAAKNKKSEPFSFEKRFGASLSGATVGNFTRIGSNCTICNHATVPDGADILDCTAVH